MKRVVELAAVVALIAIAIFFIVLTLSVNAVSRELVGAIGAAHHAADSTEAAAASIEPAIVDLRRSLEIAGGTLNLARDTMRDERSTIRAANEQTIATMQNVDRLVAGAADSQRDVATRAATALASVEPVMRQTQADLAALEPVISAAKPVLDSTAATMANADRISADLATITDGAVQPRPWYKRWAGYLWMPVKLATIFAK